MREPRLYRWWKALPDSIRRSIVFVVGMVLILVSPLVGSVPGPGGIIVFLAGIAVLGSEFDWAESLQEVIMEKVPQKVKRHWRPTLRWQRVFDTTSLLLLTAAVVCYARGIYLPVLSFTTAAIAIAVFNRNRLQRFKAFLKRKR